MGFCGSVEAFGVFGYFGWFWGGLGLCGFWVWVLGGLVWLKAWLVWFVGLGALGFPDTCGIAADLGCFGVLCECLIVFRGVWVWLVVQGFGCGGLSPILVWFSCCWFAVACLLYLCCWCKLWV